MAAETPSDRHRGTPVGIPDTSSVPVQILRDTATALEAAVLECLDKPRKGAVHKIRTSTRRLEAELNLLSVAGGFPALEKQSKRMRKLLRQLRGAAGDVRDLDVQMELVEKEAKDAPTDTLDREADRLGRALAKRRRKEANRLVELLGKDRRKLPERTRDLLEGLENAGEEELEETRLVELVRGWYRTHVEPHWNGAEIGDPDELHAVRKIAKLARYLAETAPEGAARARRLAEHFEAVQQAGGQWHDWLLLSEIAEDELGRKAAMPARFRAHADEALAEFRHRLGYRM